MRDVDAEWLSGLDATDGVRSLAFCSEILAHASTIVERRSESVSMLCIFTNAVRLCWYDDVEQCSETLGVHTHVSCATSTIKHTRIF